MLKNINVFLVIVLSMLSLDSYGQTKDDGPYLPSPNVVKAAGTWVGVYGDVNFKMNLRVRKRYIANANYSTDILEGNYAFGNAKSMPRD